MDLKRPVSVRAAAKIGRSSFSGANLKERYFGTSRLDQGIKIGSEQFEESLCFAHPDLKAAGPEQLGSD